MASKQSQQQPMAGNVKVIGSVMTQSQSSQAHGQGRSKHGTPLWLGTAEHVQNHASEIMNNLKSIRDRYRQFRDWYGQQDLQPANTDLANYNDELFSFCDANRRKYMPELADKTMRMEKERQDDQKVIQHYEAKTAKLERELKEAVQAKEHALNRLSNLHSRLLKYGNPEITDLSDENRPTNLGQNFKQVYEDEWTDAFEFLTEKRSQDIRLKDGDAIDMLYAMIKNCNEVCNAALKGQHEALAQLVSDPAYMKADFSRTMPIKHQAGGDLISFADQGPQKPQPGNQSQIGHNNARPNTAKMGDMNDAGQNPESTKFANFQKKSVDETNIQSQRPPSSTQQAAKINIPVQSFSSGQMTDFSKTMPAKAQMGRGLNSFDQGQQGPLGGNKTQIVNKNVQPNTAKPAQMANLFDARQVSESTKPATSRNANDAATGQLGVKVECEVPIKLEVPFKEFSKSVAAFVIKHVTIADILSAINKENQFQEDVLQNTSVQTYLEKCFRLCWLMQVQHPPMLMGFGTTPGADFDHNVFETYTNRGAKISRVVWPPVYLHKDGPLVCKGYADGTK